MNIIVVLTFLSGKMLGQSRLMRAVVPNWAVLAAQCFPFMQGHQLGKDWSF